MYYEDLSETIKLIPAKELAAVRLDKYLAEQLPDLSRSYLQKLILDGNVTVNQKQVKSNYKTSAGDIIEIAVPEPEEPDILPEDIPLNILYEDEDILVVNKPKGMVEIGRAACRERV